MIEGDNNKRFTFFAPSELKLNIKTLGSKYDLLFFFESICQDATILAGSLHEFQNLYEWDVWPISLDNAGIIHFPSAITSNSLWGKYNISVHPALIAVHRATKKHYPIVYGASTLENIERAVLNLP